MRHIPTFVLICGLSIPAYAVSDEPAAPPQARSSLPQVIFGTNNRPVSGRLKFKGAGPVCVCGGPNSLSEKDLQKAEERRPKAAAEPKQDQQASDANRASSGNKRDQ